MNQTPEDPYRSSESAREIAGLTPTDLCRNQCYVCTRLNLRWGTSTSAMNLRALFA